MNLPSIPKIAQDDMAGETISVEGVLVDFPIPILPEIGVEPTT